MMDRILAGQRAARDHIAANGADKPSVLWLEDWVKEELLVRDLMRDLVHEKSREDSGNG